MRFLVLTAAFATAMYGQLFTPPQPAPASPATPAAGAQTDIGPNTVVATIAGIGVTVADVRKIYETAPNDLLQMLQQSPQQALESVYLSRYLASEAEKLGLDKQSPLNEEIAEAVRQLTVRILAQAMVNQTQNGYLVSGEQIDDFYKKNQSRWEEATIKIILIAFKPGAVAPAKVAAEVSPTPGGADPTSTEAMKAAIQHEMEKAHPLSERTEAEAQALAVDLVKQLRAGADFAKLVTQYSDDAESKASGGDFGTPIKATSSFAPEIKKSVLAMKEGDISDPVRQGNGLYIIRLEKKTVTPLDSVRDSIVTEIRNNHMHDYMTDLNNRFTPQVQRPEFFLHPLNYMAQQPK